MVLHLQLKQKNRMLKTNQQTTLQKLGKFSSWIFPQCFSQSFRHLLRHR